MPVILKETNWKQDDNTVCITLPLEACKCMHIDVMFASFYVKINCSPYFYEAFLHQKINPELSSTKFIDDKLNIILVKQTKCEWEEFLFMPCDKQHAKELRKIALKEHSETELKNWNSKIGKCNENEKFAISRQIQKNEEIAQEKIDLFKQEQELFFKKDYEDVGDRRCHRRVSSTCSEEGVTTEADYDGDEESVTCSSAENIPLLLNGNRFATKSRLPMIRSSAVIKMRMTPHKDDVPKRESTSGNELKSDNVTVEEDRKESKDSERKVDEIKQEAKCHFESGRFEEAVKSYSKAIQLCPSKAAYYSNRASAYLALNANVKARKDCTKALSLLRPPTEENLKARILCYVRRGTAYVKLHKYHKGLLDYEKAFEFDPLDTKLAEDVKSIRYFLATSSDTGEDEQKIDVSEPTDSSYESEDKPSCSFHSLAS